MMRFRQFFRQTSTSHNFRGNALLAVAGAIGVCIGGIAWAQVDGINQNALQNAPAQYQKWLNNDVRWIITPEERAAYLSLQTNDERDMFIEQFWERRNPPGAPPYTFRQEHYRRIAYTNEHFAADKLGQEMDRGRIYIEYGPPDEIDHQLVELDGVARHGVTWHYRSIHVVMKFVDVCSCGDYKLQSQ